MTLRVTLRPSQIKSAVLFLKIGHSNLQIFGNASIRFVIVQHARKTMVNMYLVCIRQEEGQERTRAAFIQFICMDK